jgi:hypothetical protein
MALITCPHCQRNVNPLHAICPYCGKPAAVGSAALAGKLLGAAEFFGGLAYFTGLAWMALDPARPLAAVFVAALGGAAFMVGRLFRDH